MTSESANPSRPTGDQMLAAQRRAEAGAGRLRIYMGMPRRRQDLQDARGGAPAHDRGTDVVVGFVETYGRRHTAALLDGLEIVPRRAWNTAAWPWRRWTRTDHRRHPAVALVDELAHNNVPGSAREKRWQDVDLIRDAGIEVISTCNVQHVESIADAVETSWAYRSGTHPR